MQKDQHYIRKLQYAVAVHRDESSYRKLFLLFHNPLIRFATTFLRSEETAEEIYSDTMLKIWLSGIELNQIENLRHYLFKVTKNASLNYIKKHSKVRFVELDSIVLNQYLSDSPEQLLIRNEFQIKVGEAVNALPPKCQLVYRLIKEEEFNYKQTAEILDLSVNTIERHMTIALRKIVANLKPYVTR